jgi:hypothetical protein
VRPGELGRCAIQSVGPPRPDGPRRIPACAGQLSSAGARLTRGRIVVPALDQVSADHLAGQADEVREHSQGVLVLASSAALRRRRRASKGAS